MVGLFHLRRFVIHNITCGFFIGLELVKIHIEPVLKKAAFERGFIHKGMHLVFLTVERRAAYTHTDNHYDRKHYENIARRYAVVNLGFCFDLRNIEGGIVAAVGGVIFYGAALFGCLFDLAATFCAALGERHIARDIVGHFGIGQFKLFTALRTGEFQSNHNPFPKKLL